MNLHMSAEFECEETGAIRICGDFDCSGGDGGHGVESDLDHCGKRFGPRRTSCMRVQTNSLEKAIKHYQLL